jgi:hypothetical protein
MKQTTRYLLFIGLPFFLAGAIFVLIGVMRHHPLNEPVGWSFGDTINLVLGGAIPAIVGAVAERATRKSGKPSE